MCSTLPNDHPRKLVALKVQKSASQYTEAALDEIKLLNDVKLHMYGKINKKQIKPKPVPPPRGSISSSSNGITTSSGTEEKKDEEKALVPGADCIVELYDHFTLHGPHGKHVCLVFETMGSNFLSLIKKTKYVPHGSVYFLFIFIIYLS